MSRVYALVAVAVLVLGCLGGGGPPSNQDRAEQKYSPLSAADYSLEYPESYKKEAVNFADGVFYSPKATFVISRLNAESSDLYALGSKLFDELDGKYSITETQIDYLNNGEINPVGNNQWFVICYNTLDDSSSDRCVALTLCNSKQIVMNLVTPKGNLPALKTDFVHAMESFNCS